MNFNIVDFGAKAEDKTINTEYIQKAIDACAESGGGTVIVPSGRYVTGTIYLKSNIELRLEHNAVLKASENLHDYNETSEYPQNWDCADEGWCGKHLIIAVNQENILISGSGTIEGCGDAFYGGELKGNSNYIWNKGYLEIAEGAPLRPGQMVCFIECRHVGVSNITMCNSSGWNLFFHGCDYVQAVGLKILNDKRHANSDGIDIDSCSCVTVSDCIINTGDDCIAVRGDAARLADKTKACEYVTITNCILSNSTCAVRIGIGPGSIRHINISNLVIAESGEGITFMTEWKGRKKVSVSDVICDNITGDDIGIPIQLYTEEMEIKHVTVSNYRTYCKCGVRIYGKKGSITDLTLRNIDIYDKEHIYTHPETAAQERKSSIIDVHGVNGLVLDKVRVFALDSYFDDRSEIINLKNTFVALDDLKLIYKGEEKAVACVSDI